MKVLIRWGKALGLAGGILLGSLLTNSPQALALTNEQVLQQLRNVPVFTLANQQQGSLLLPCPTQEQTEAVQQCILVFMGVQDAQDFLAGLRQENPEVGGAVEISPVSLAQIYWEMTQTQQEQPVTFNFVPIQQDVEAARTILQQEGKNPDEFRGVPLFIARAVGEDNNEFYPSVERNGEAYVPMFFSSAQLQQQIEKLQEANPDFATDVKIQVQSLGQVIEVFRTQDDEALLRFKFEPYPESYEFVRSLEDTQPARPGQASPGQAPGQAPGQTRSPQAQPQQRPSGSAQELQTTP